MSIVNARRELSQPRNGRTLCASLQEATHRFQLSSTRRTLRSIPVRRFVCIMVSKLM